MENNLLKAEDFKIISTEIKGNVLERVWKTMKRLIEKDYVVIPNKYKTKIILDKNTEIKVTTTDYGYLLSINNTQIQLYTEGTLELVDKLKDIIKWHKFNYSDAKPILIGIAVFAFIVVSVITREASISIQQNISLKQHVADSLYKTTNRYKDSIAARFKQDSINIEYQKELETLKELEHKKFLKTPAGKVYTYCINKNVTVTEEECKQATEGYIWIGMHIYLLEAVRGLPNDINISNYGYGNQYQFVWNNYNISYFYCDEDGIVDSYN